MVELLKKKRNGEALTKEEISYIIKGFVSGEIPDYQLSAFMMAVYFQGMNEVETATFTDCMMRSGELIDLSEIPGVKVDKHSTGGVGDKTTIVLAPLVAAAGGPLAKMSGRGLGHTGGTIDKLESIPGFSMDMTREDFIYKLKKHNIAICGQNQRLVPADKKLYALRDVTATVDNISLIASSIMSKKLACGADAIVIDIKVGEGAYMKTAKEAEALAKVLIGIGKQMDRRVVAIISAMHQPLGLTIGNALEVKEAIETLQGGGPEDLKQLCLELGTCMLQLGKIAHSYEEGIDILNKLIDSGKAYDKFLEFVDSQGGDISYVKNPDLLPCSNEKMILKSREEGYITELDALKVGLTSVKLGAGRETKASQIDLGAGIILKKKIGDFVKKGDPLAILYSQNAKRLEEAATLLESAYIFKQVKPILKPLIINKIK